MVLQFRCTCGATILRSNGLTKRIYGLCLPARIGFKDWGFEFEGVPWVCGLGFWCVLVEACKD